MTTTASAVRPGRPVLPDTAADVTSVDVPVRPGRHAPRVVIAGDSTAAPYVATAYPMCGWGAHLAGPLTARRARRAFAATPDGSLPESVEAVEVIDLARNGATTESYREEGLWDAVLDATGPGDTVLLQFGHNDQKREHLQPFGGFTDNLRTMIGEVRALGAVPVLCTPVARRRFEGGVLVPSHGQYPAAVAALAGEEGVALLDLHERTSALISGYGEDGSAALFTKLAPGQSLLYPEGIDDDTHFSITGALAVAGIVADLLDPVLAAGARPHSHLTP
jgi:lysophospholipase L1-like esterase